VLLGQVLTDENLDDLVSAAAYKTKTEVDHLVASLRPREAPRDGIRRLPSPPSSTPALTVAPAQTATPAATLFAPSEAETPSNTSTIPVDSSTERSAPVSNVAAGQPVAPRPRLLEAVSPVDPPQNHGTARSRAEIRAVGRDEWSLRVTIDGACKADLEMLQHLLSHTCGRDLASALREAIRCGIEKHGKRRGAVPTKHRKAQPGPARRARASADETNSASANATKCRTNDAPPAAADLARSTDSPRDHIPAAVKQAVYERDGGCCSFVAADGRRCGSKWKLEFDHAHSAFLGGPATIENVRLRCRAHNLLHAEQVFGREHMGKFRAGARVPRAEQG
jgi:5-methylcytosine-specific restriction endonuclease McrA